MKKGDTIQGRTLYKGGHYLRKYGRYYFGFYTIEYYKNKTCLFSYQFCHILFYTGNVTYDQEKKQISRFKREILSLIGASQVGVYQGLDYCRPVMLVHSQIRRNQGRGRGVVPLPLLADQLTLFQPGDRLRTTPRTTRISGPKP